MLTLEAMLSILSPLAGLVADIVYGRLRFLKFSTYLILACTIGVLLMSTLITATQILILGYGLSTLIFGAYLGRVFFQANIVQFGTDQLRDMPTVKSVHFIHIYVSLHAVTYLFTSTVRINSHAYSLHNLITHTYTIVLLEVFLSFSSIFSIGMLLIIDKSKDFFYVEKLKINPYKLLYHVIKFAVKHKKPIKRSAFTYCDEEIPSRIDYGKQRYGGPFTTEQVEDVKVLLRIVLVLVTLGPVLLLDSNINIMLEFYIRGHRNKQDISKDGTQFKYFYASGSSPQSSFHSFYSQANI